MGHSGVVKPCDGDKLLVRANKAAVQRLIGRKLKAEDVLFRDTHIFGEIGKKFRLAVLVLCEEGQKLRLHVEFPVFIDVAHDMDRRARQNQKRLFDVDIDGLRLAVLILDENTSRKGERTVEPAVDNQSAVGFERQTLDAAVDFGGDCFDAEAGRILMRRTDAETGLARVATDAERGALRAFFREIIGFSLFDLPCIALVELHGSRSVQHGGELVRRLKGGRGIAQKF